MPYRAWAYIWGVFFIGSALSMLTFASFRPETAPWLVFAALTLLATCAQLFKAEAQTNHVVFSASPVFYFAGVLLLPPFLFILLITIPHLIEWAKERLVKSHRLANWYIQPFNITKYIITGVTSSFLYTALTVPPGATVITPTSLPAIAVAAITYLFVNQSLLGLVLVVARGVSWRDSGVLDPESLLPEFIMMCLGLVVAGLCEVAPLLVVPALAPLVLMYRSLLIPQLKQEAQTDAKTGLLNVRHFNKVFVDELERARRFNRPLAVIMADLDLLRNINNTYGHLAGDIVIAGIGQLIRKTIREYDIAGRFGGEEFVIVLPEAGRLEAETLAERLRHVIASTTFDVATSAAPINATMSLGIACFPEDATTVTDLAHEADVAVYLAKRQGRNRVACASAILSLGFLLTHANGGPTVGAI